MVDDLRHLSDEAATVSALLRTADLDARVADCPDWALRDLALHLGQVHRWATGVVRTGELVPLDTSPVPDDDLADWLAEGATALGAVLAAADPDQPCWTFAGDQRAGFWVRRQAVETAVHRVDAQRAVGTADPVAADLAEDGVEEVVALIHPRQVARGRTPAPESAATLVSTTGRTWVLGEGTPSATVTAPPEVLLLLLWHRAALADAEVEGDRDAAQALLARALTP